MCKSPVFLMPAICYHYLDLYVQLIQMIYIEKGSIKMSGSEKDQEKMKSGKDGADRRSRRTDAKREKLRQQSAARKTMSMDAPVQSKKSPDKKAKKAVRAGDSADRSVFVISRWKVYLVLAVIVLAVIAYAAVQITDYISRITDIKLTDEGFEHAERYENCTVIDGIDVSEHQKEEIAWKKAKTGGADYVFIRAGYRTTDKGKLKTDARFEENIRDAEKAGLMVGAYFYSQALDSKEAAEEADYLLELVKDYDITMPLAIDFELYSGGRLANKIEAGEMPVASAYHDIVQAFCRKVEDAGYESAVYANLDMLTNYMDADVLDDSETIWLARYNATADLDADYWFWQCSDKGQIGGYKGNIDHDFWYIEPNKVYPTRAAGKGREKNRISIGNCRVKFNKKNYKLKKFRAIPKINVSDADGPLREDVDYVVNYVNNTESGTGLAVIRGTGLYKDWIAVPFNIE